MYMTAAFSVICKATCGSVLVVTLVVVVLVATMG